MILWNRILIENLLAFIKYISCLCRECGSISFWDLMWVELLHFVDWWLSWALSRLTKGTFILTFKYVLDHLFCCLNLPLVAIHDVHQGTKLIFIWTKIIKTFGWWETFLDWIVFFIKWFSEDGSVGVFWASKHVLLVKLQFFGQDILKNFRNEYKFTYGLENIKYCLMQGHYHVPWFRKSWSNS